jgi:hypothetical protein
MCRGDVKGLTVKFQQTPKHMGSSRIVVQNEETLIRFMNLRWATGVPRLLRVPINVSGRADALLNPLGPFRSRLEKSGELASARALCAPRLGRPVKGREMSIPIRAAESTYIWSIGSPKGRLHGGAAQSCRACGLVKVALDTSVSQCLTHAEGARN